MFSNFLKARRQYVNVDSAGGLNMKKKALIFIIAAAIFVLAFVGTGSKDENENKAFENVSSEDIVTAEYIAENEKRLEEILTSVQGAGKVKAMITIEEIGEKVIASDKKTETTQETASEKTSRQSKQEQTAIIYGSGADEEPFVLKEKLPSPSGVLIVASGAGDEKVRLEIYEAVKALYGISGHRIKVAKGNIK